MTDEELDNARADEAIFNSGAITCGDVTIMSILMEFARLSREGWMPPKTLEQTLLEEARKLAADRDAACEIMIPARAYERYRNAVIAGEWDHTADIQAMKTHRQQSIAIERAKIKNSLFPGLDHIANFLNALDTEGMTVQEVRSAIYKECIQPYNNT